MRAPAILALLALAACATESDPARGPGRLTARPSVPTAHARATGETAFTFGGERNGRLYVPAQLRERYPLMLLLHGAGGTGKGIEHRMQWLADEFGVIIAAPDSRDATWDVTHGTLGPDVDFIDRVLRDVFARYPIDPKHVAVAGFSDGASYALTIGVMNGDLFTHVISFSPGFIATRYGYGRPAIFIAHGKQDEILSFGNTSNMLVPGLRRNGYRVTFRPFDGPHTIVPDVAREAARWWLSGVSPPDAAQ